jgi:hypothetical protein
VSPLRLDDELLRQYVQTFFGYGNYRGNWWLVGMEEGGGNSVDEVANRLRLWNERGRRELEDVDMFSSSPQLGKWFTARPPLQPTWRGLVRMILAAEGRATDAETARQFQGSELGRLEGNTCILELMPLPSPSVGHWIYGSCSGLPELADRATYMATVKPTRVEHLRNRIAEHQPKAVVFYSRQYQPEWELVTPIPFGAPNHAGIQFLRTDETLFVMTPHPTYPGLTTQYFVEAGRQIADAIR